MLRVLVYTQPRASELAQALNRSNLPAQTLSLQQVGFLDNEFDWSCASESDAWIWTSPNAVRSQATRLTQIRATAQRIKHWTIGTGTAEALQAELPNAKVFAAQQDADSLVQQLLQQPTLNRLLVIRGRQGRDDWLETLRLSGRRVSVVYGYEILDREPESQEIQALQRVMFNPDSDAMDSVIWVVGSTPLANLLHHWLKQKGPEWLLRAQRNPCVSIHPNIVHRLQQLGFARVELIAPGSQGLINGLQ